MTREGVVVVGAAGSLGSAFCRATENHAASRWLFDKVADPNHDVRACDLASADAIVSALELIPFDACDMWRVLMTAGVYRGALDEPSPPWAEIRQSLEVNLIGVVHFIQGVIRQIRAHSKRARIGVVSSAAARVGSHDLGYGIAKAGLEGLVRSVSKHHAQHGITIIGIAPGVFDSPMSAAQDRERKRAAVASTHLLRAMRLDEVVSCVRFAVFDAPDALTGTFLSPNGGQVLV